MRPELVAEVQYAAWSGAGRVRHAVYLGLREDKPPPQVVRDIADPEAERILFKPRGGGAVVHAPRKWKGAIPPVQDATAPGRPPAAAARIVVAKPPKRAEEMWAA